MSRKAHGFAVRRARQAAAVWRNYIGVKFVNRVLEDKCLKGGCIWDSRMIMTVSREKCTKRFVQSARKSAKFLLSLRKTGRFTARNAFQKEKIAAVKRVLTNKRNNSAAGGQETMLCPNKF
jgi:hypothetical protein